MSPGGAATGSDPRQSPVAAIRSEGIVEAKIRQFVSREAQHCQQAATDGMAADYAARAADPHHSVEGHMLLNAWVKLISGRLTGAA